MHFIGKTGFSALKTEIRSYQNNSKPWLEYLTCERLPIHLAIRRGADAMNRQVGALELFFLTQAQSHRGL